MNDLRLYMVLLGCTPKGRLIEQHDVFFGIGNSLKALVPAMNRAWPEAEHKLHIDSWREVTQAGAYQIKILQRSEPVPFPQHKLFFINLGGYKPGDLEEYHYKMIVVAGSKGEAIQQAKQSAFYKHTGFQGAESHVDDKFGIDVDDSYEIADILPEAFRSQYTISVQPGSGPEDELHIGYLVLTKL